MAADIQRTLTRRGRQAVGELWELAHAPDATLQQRERLLQWFAEMAAGKPRTMEQRTDAGPDGPGVVVLPPVMEAERPPETGGPVEI